MAKKRPKSIKRARRALTPRAISKSNKPVRSAKEPTPPAAPTEAEWSLDTLLDRAFGGGDVAARPTVRADDFWPRGPGPYGVDRLIERLVGIAEGAKVKRQSHWLFLLGGAGNGKSEAARGLLRRLHPTAFDGEDEDARRTYTHKLSNGVQLVVLNDATIATRGEYPGGIRIALATDMASWLHAMNSGPSVVLACVNRGILIEELHALEKAPSTQLKSSQQVLRWLDAGVGLDAESAGPLELKTVPSLNKDATYYRSAKVKIGSHHLELHAVSVDVGSLLEPRPEDNAEVPVDALPQIQVAEQLRCAPAARLGSVGGGLAESLLRGRLASYVEGRDEHCPLRANVEALLNDDIRASWLTCIRGAELASGRQFTYRDFWGIIALSCVGPRTFNEAEPDEAGGSSVTRFIDQRLEAARGAADSFQRLEILGSLSRHRLHSALFQGTACPSLAGRQPLPPAFPTLLGFLRVDPADDVTIFSREVSDAVDSLAVGLLPSSYLLDKVPAVRPAWSAFDTWLEQAVVAAVRSTQATDRYRRSVVSWFAAYLLRLLGSCVGGLGHEDVLEAWYNCWHRANETFPGDLDRGFRRIIAPAMRTQDYNSPYLAVPALGSRAEPYSDTEAAADSLVALIAADQLRLKPLRKLDRLWIELTSGGERGFAVHSPLDFVMLREAVALSNGLAGFTESSREAAPRMERARAALLAPLQGAAIRYATVIDSRVRELGR